MCLWLALLLHAFAGAQPVNRFHADISNGLPTNNVYCLVVDSLGYLWIATADGVLRYNGYEFRLYTTADGLPNNDVWNLHLDRRGRLWPATIAHSTGYFRNNRYHKAVVIGLNDMLYPKMITDYKDGVLMSNNTPGPGMLAEKNDTLRLAENDIGVVMSATGDGRIMQMDSNYAYFYEYRNGKIVLRKRLPNPWGNLLNSIVQKSGIIQMPPYSDTFNIYSLGKDPRKRSLRFVDEKGRPEQISILIYNEGTESWAIGRQTIYGFDTTLQISKRLSARSLTGNDDVANDNSIVNIKQSRFWGLGVSTNNRGFFINYPSIRRLQPAPGLDLSSASCIGNIDGVSYWWSLRNRTLTTIDATGNVCSDQYKGLFDVVKILPYDGEKHLIFDKAGLYWWYRSSRTLKGVPTSWTSALGEVMAPSDRPFVIPYSRDILLLSPNHFYLSSYRLHDGYLIRDTLYLKDIGKAFFNLNYDSVRNIYWFNHVDRLSFRTPEGQHVRVGDSILSYFGITTIEKLLIDQRYGNLLLKDNDNLYCFDFRNGRVHMLFRQYNLKGARLFVHRGMVILAGKFGVLFSRILGPARFSAPLVYNNIKNSIYSMALDAGFASNRMYLKTDRSTYYLSLPSENDFTRSDANIPPYKIVFEYRDTLYDMRRLKVLPITPGEHRIGVDIINPFGNGKLLCYSRVEGVDPHWQLLNGNEVHLPELTAGKTYTLSLMASDDAWRSDPVSISLYVVPEWWQEPGWKLFLWSYSALILFMLLLETVLLTRFFVVRSARRKQFLISMALRSVYAQINPHFIFNTLNTALYFIRKKQLDEAAVHVTRFSHLLRAYLHSSRNRYITIGEEITNLNNYIQLQQTRFENVFTYEIRTDDVLPRHTLSIPSLLLQPLVENAINHGLVPKGEDGHLSISFHWNEKEHILTCIIDDNGVGRKHARKIKTHEVQKKESYGSDLIRELIATFNQYEKLNIRIDYLDKQSPLTGTQVTIEIKNPRYEQ